MILQALHWQFGLSRVYGHSSRLPVVAEHFPPSAGQHSGTLLQPTVSCGRSATRYRIASLRVCVCVFVYVYVSFGVVSGFGFTPA